MTATVELMTYADVIDWLSDYQRGNPTAESYRNARRAIASAYRIFAHEHSWSYYIKVGRVCTEAPYTTGSVTYDFTGGTVERQLTLADGTWPDWAAFGTVIFNNVQYPVGDRISDTVLQLHVDSAPKADITEATQYTLMRDTYTLPSDFIKLDQMYTPENWRRVDYVHPREWLVAQRYNVTSSNTPVMYTLLGNPDFMGSMSVGFYPFPDTATTLDFVYYSRPRPLRVERERTGRVQVTAASDQISGLEGETTWTSDLEGAVIRISQTDDEDYPTGREGINPYAAERIVSEVDDSDTITSDQQFFTSVQNARYVISDPLDVEPGVMTTAFLRCCEKELAHLLRWPDRQQTTQLYELALDKAKNADSRSVAPRSVHTEAEWSRRLAYMPSGEDVE